MALEFADIGIRAPLDTRSLSWMRDKGILLPTSLKSPGFISPTIQNAASKTYRQGAAKHYRKVFVRKPDDDSAIPSAPTVQY